MSHPLTSSLSPIVAAPRARGLDSIREQVEERGIRRLCHFTSSRNLFGILSSERGLRSPADLRRNGIAVSGDRFRLDGYPDHVCCSVEFPNVWSFEKIRKGRGGGDWVVLFIEPKHLWQAGAKFCPVNAARESGGRIAEGPAAFRAMFAPIVRGRRTFRRKADHPDYLPTDQQAEVLIPDGIPRRDISGVAVFDAAQAGREHDRLRRAGIEAPPSWLAPAFYDPTEAGFSLRSGWRPEETEWSPQNR